MKKNEVIYVLWYKKPPSYINIKEKMLGANPWEMNSPFVYNSL